MREREREKGRGRGRGRGRRGENGRIEKLYLNIMNLSTLVTNRERERERTFLLCIDNRVC